MNPLTLSVFPEPLAVCRLKPETALPPVLSQARFFSVTRTDNELSVVLPQALADPSWRVEPDWSALAVTGPLDFSLTGILAGLSAHLAAAQISIFAISTFDTDLILVKTDMLGAAITVLKQAGHQIISERV